MKSKYLLIVVSLLLLTSCMEQKNPSRQTQIDQLRSQLKANQQQWQEKIAQLNNQYQNLEQNFKNQQKNFRQGQAEQNVNLDELRLEIQKIKGLIEETGYQLNKLNLRQEKDAKILEQSLQEVGERLKKLPEKGKKKSSFNSRNFKGKKSSKVYNIGRQQMEKKKYNDARATFNYLITKRKKNNLTDNAQYWIAECYYAERKFKKAIIEFQKVLDNYKKSDKTCHSLLKQGFSFYELKKKKEARAFLREVISRCPKSIPARKAKEKLRKR